MDFVIEKKCARQFLELFSKNSSTISSFMFERLSKILSKAISPYCGSWKVILVKMSMMSISSSSLNRFYWRRLRHKSRQFKEIYFYKFLRRGSTRGPPGKFCIVRKDSLKFIARYSILLILVTNVKQLISIL